MRSAAVNQGSRHDILVSKERRDKLRFFHVPTLLPFYRISFRRGEKTLSSVWVLKVALPRAWPLDSGQGKPG